MKLLELLNGIALRISVRFGYKGKPKDPEEKHCVICGYARADHSRTENGVWVPGKWVHEFQEFDWRA